MLHSLKAAIAARLVRFARRRDGNIALIFGLCAIPVIVGAGVAIDAARAYMIKMELESALDSSVLAVASSPGLTAAQLQARMTSYFNANYEGTPISQNLNVSMTDPTQPVITVTATVSVPTTFLELVNIPDVTVAASSQVTKGTNALELALVLDNTGSMMCGDGSGCSTPSHISTLRTDAQTIVDTLFADSVDPTKLKISIVPYVTAVNIGPAMSQSGILNTNVPNVSGVYKDYKGVAIKDPTGANIVYDPTQSLTNQATNAWRGCVVEPTVAGEDASGNGPDISEPAGGWTGATMGSWWTPFFWKSGTATTYNGFNSSGSDNTWYISTKNPKQSILYQEIDGNVNSATDNSRGPNLACPTPLVRLTNTQATLDTAVQNMTAWANSGTAITIGMVWGWRTLSPNPPFSDGQPYGTPSLIKAVVLETDGDAEVAGNTQNNTLDYTGYGYISDGKLGSSTSGLYPPYGTPAVGTANYYLQQRLTTLCTNMKNAGIVIFTVGLGDGATNQQLQSCAGPPGKGMFYAAPTASDLTTAFQQIAVALNSLRLSE